MFLLSHAATSPENVILSNVPENELAARRLGMSAAVIVLASKIFKFSVPPMVNAPETDSLSVPVESTSIVKTELSDKVRLYDW